MRVDINYICEEISIQKSALLQVYDYVAEHFLGFYVGLVMIIVILGT